MKRCEGCDIILGGLYEPSKENPNRCTDCVDFEIRIKKVCLCGKNIYDRYPIEYYKRHGNYCLKCISEINEGIRRGKEHRR